MKRQKKISNKIKMKPIMLKAWLSKSISENVINTNYYTVYRYYIILTFNIKFAEQLVQRKEFIMYTDYTGYLLLAPLNNTLF